MYSLSIGEGWYAGRPVAAGSTPSNPRSRSSSASTNTSTARTGLLSSTQSSRHSGSNVACPRSSPATKPGIKSPADSVGDHGIRRVFTQPGPRSDVSQPLRSQGVPLTTVWCWFESCRGRQQNQQLIDFDFFYATGNSHIDRASFTACLQVWFASIISWKAGAKQTSDFL